MKKCPACGREWPDTMNVCPRDKSSLVPPPAKTGGVGKKLSDLVKKLFVRPECR